MKNPSSNPAAIKKPVGVLALQGDFKLHESTLYKLGYPALLIKKPIQLNQIKRLIIPGGESTTLLKLANSYGMIEPIKNFAKRGGKIFGTCAGAILLANKVTQPAQTSLGLIDVEIERNSYGRQINSTDAEGMGKPPLPDKIDMVFIRAPKIITAGKNVKILATYHNDPVLVQQKNILIATFHPELTSQLYIYKYWLID